LTALSDADEARLRSTQLRFGLGSAGCADYRDTFERIDAAILALPNHLHAPIGCDLLSRGIHVLCEKPLAMSTKECEQLCRAAQDGGSILAVGYVTRFFPSTVLTKRLLATGFLGSLKSFDYEFGTAGGWAPLSGYDLARATSGGGVLVVSGSHFIDRMLYLFEDVQLRKFADDSHGGVEANCLAEVSCSLGDMRFPGRITLSKTHPLANRLRVTGEKGVLEIREGESSYVTFLPSLEETRHQITASAESAGPVEEDYFKVQLEDFVRAIFGGGRPKIDGREGSNSVVFMDQCYEIATRLDEPWVFSPLDRLRTAMPSETPASSSSQLTEAEVG